MSADRTTDTATNVEQAVGDALLGAQEVQGFDSPYGEGCCERDGHAGSGDPGVSGFDKAKSKKEFKTCSKCGHQGPLRDFVRDRNVCYPCQRAYENSYNAKNRERVRARNRRYRESRKDEVVERQRLDHLKYMRERYSERQMLISARKRAKKNDWPFNLELEDIVIPEVCPLLGITIVKRGKISNRDSSPSLDRIDSQKGYVKGNVAVISYRANRIKNDATDKELKLLARNIDEYRNGSLSFG